MAAIILSKTTLISTSPTPRNAPCPATRTSSTSPAPSERAERNAAIASLPPHIAAAHVTDMPGYILPRLFRALAAWIAEKDRRIAERDRLVAEKDPLIAAQQERINSLTQLLEIRMEVSFLYC